MIITNKQIIMLYQIAIDSLKISDGGCTPFNFNTQTRQKLLEEILTQQSSKLINLDEGTPNE